VTTQDFNRLCFKPKL